MQKKFVLMLLMALLGISVLLFADVKTDYSHQVDFGKYKTYSWIKVEAGNDLWRDRIQREVDTQLQTKANWNRVPSGGDTSVAAFGSTQTQPTLTTFYNNIGGGWFWGGFDGTATTTVDRVEVGTLVVDIFDAATKKLIWRGMASNTLSGNPEKNVKKLHDDVADMFKHYPPKSKG
jgi:hypothetical protein